MPAFSYKAFDARGQVAAGRIDAASELEVDSALADAGLVPFEVSRASGPANAAESRQPRGQGGVPWWRREIGGRGRPALSELARFAEELALLLQAGVSIDQALRMMQDGGGAFVRRVAETLRDRILGGETLSSAMRSIQAVFGDEACAIVRSSETYGDLAGGLDRLAALLNRRAALQSELRSALIYPAVLLVASLGVMIVVVAVLIPSVRPLFDEARAPMPLFIKLADQIGAVAAEHWPVIAAAALVAGVACRTAWTTPSFRARVDAVVLELSIWRGAAMPRDAARSMRALGAQQTAGVALLPALQIAQDSLGNREMRRRIALAVEQVRDGTPLNAALRQTGCFPSMACQLMTVGEATGRLGPILLQGAEALERAQQIAMKRAMTLLTPLLTLGVGLLVGLLMISLMTAITSLNDFALR